MEAERIFNVVRVDLQTGNLEEFATNAGSEGGPASRLGTGGLEHPIAARFAPRGKALYVVDFGVFHIGRFGLEAKEETGTLWRITRR